MINQNDVDRAADMTRLQAELKKLKKLKKLRTQRAREQREAEKKKCIKCLEAIFDLTTERDSLAAEVSRLTKERDHWKANHSNVAWQKRVLQDRPDLKDRAASMLRKDAELTQLRAEVERQRGKLQEANKEGDELWVKRRQQDAELTALRDVAEAAEGVLYAIDSYRAGGMMGEGCRVYEKKLRTALAAAKDANNQEDKG